MMVVTIQNLHTGNMIVASTVELAKVYIEQYIKTQTPFSVDYGYKP